MNREPVFIYFIQFLTIELFIRLFFPFTRIDSYFSLLLFIIIFLKSPFLFYNNTYVEFVKKLQKKFINIIIYDKKTIQFFYTIKR